MNPLRFRLANRYPEWTLGLASTGLFVGVFLLLNPGQGWPAFPHREIAPLLWAGLLVFGAVAWIWRQGNHRLTPFVLLNLFALGYGGCLALLWGDQEFLPYGTTNDGWFNHAMATKAAFNMGNVDFAYKGLHSFYPPLFPWTAGKLAQVTGIPAWVALKQVWLSVNFFLPFGIFLLWRKSVSSWMALLLAVGGMYLSREMLPGKSYEAIALNLMVPFVLHYLLGHGLQGSLRSRIGWGGLVAGLLFLNYYYFLLLLLLFLPLQVVLLRMELKEWRATWQRIRPGALVLGVGALISLPFVLPLAYDLFSGPSESLQNRWFVPRMIRFPWAEPSHFWVLPGLALLLVAALKDRLGRDLLLLGLCQVGWIFLGMLMVLLDFPLLHAHWFGFELFLAWWGLVWGIERGLQWWQQRESSVQVHWGFALVALCWFGFAIQHSVGLRREYAFEAAEASFVPDPGLESEFVEMTRGKVFLTNRVELAAFYPVYLFISHNAHYSHPASQFRERLKFLSLISRSANPAFVAWVLRHNRFDQVDYLLLDQRKLFVGDDDFPAETHHIGVNLQFEEIRTWPWFRHQEMLPGLYETAAFESDTLKFSPAENAIAWHYADEQFRSQLQAPSQAQTEALAAMVAGRVRDYLGWRDSCWARLEP